MNNPLGVSPSKGRETGNHTRQRKNLLTSVGIEPTTSGLDLPSLCRLSYKVRQRKSGTILDGKSRRESKGIHNSRRRHYAKVLNKIRSQKVKNEHCSKFFNSSNWKEDF